MKFPEETIQNLAQYRQQNDADDSAALEEKQEYTVEELALAANTSVRNIRAYQDRGLIPPPDRKGRMGIYSEDHRSRLRVISEMLDRGYTLSSIGELFEALASGHDIAELMGLQRAVSSPWTDETPQTYGLMELMKMFGGQFSPRWLMHATEMGILEQVGAKFRAPSPKLLHAAAELVAVGIPLDDMLSVVRKLRANVESAAEDMVRLVERHCFDKYGPGLPPAEKVPERESQAPAKTSSTQLPSGRQQAPDSGQVTSMHPVSSPR